jgi:hypothetical protein
MRRRTNGKPGNTKTRSRAKFDPGVAPKIEFSFKNMATKFAKRPPAFTRRAMWKKYPIPFVWENPEPDGDAVIVRSIHKLGTYEKHLASLEAQ